jgi:hypothetical protein
LAKEGLSLVLLGKMITLCYFSSLVWIRGSTSLHFDLITKINSNINYGKKFIHDPPVCSSKINLELKYSTMKKVITGMGLMQFILMILFLFL